MGTEGNSVVVVCVSSNAIFFRTVHSKGFSKSSYDEEMKYFEYGMEKEFETVNLCINNCSKEEFVEEELSDGYEKMQYMLTSDRCKVKGHRTKERSNGRNISFKCKDIILNGSICSLRQKTEHRKDGSNEELSLNKNPATQDEWKEDLEILKETPIATNDPAYREKELLN